MGLWVSQFFGGGDRAGVDALAAVGVVRRFRFGIRLLAGEDLPHLRYAVIGLLLCHGAIARSASAVIFINTGAAGHLLEPDAAVLDMAGLVDNVVLHHLGRR